MTLGDTIVVMNDGKIQQKGTAAEIYNEPDNLFVAQFIGSPSTNVFDCTLSTDAGGVVTLASPVFDFELSAEQSRGLQVSDGDAVTLGVRPESLDLSETEDGLFDARIQVIEHHGDRDAVHLQAEGREYTAVTPQNEFDGREQRVSVSFDGDDFWLFDADGERLL